MLQETEKHHTSGRAAYDNSFVSENRGLEPISAERLFQKQVPIEKDESFIQHLIYFPTARIFFLDTAKNPL